MSMHPPMMDKLAGGHVDDMRRAADSFRRQSGGRARRHPGTTITRVIGLYLIKMGRRLAGPDVRNEPRVLTVREAMGELHPLS